MGIKEWYVAKFSDDEMGEEIRDTATFFGLCKRIPLVYSYLGTADSLIRERVFSELARRLGVDYEEIYNEWLEL